MKLIINDERIWHPLVKGAEIALTLQKEGSITIDLNGESPSLDQTEMTDLLDYLHSVGFNTNNITVLTGNPLENNTQVTIKHDPNAYYEIALLQKHINSVPQHKDIKYHFGNFVSRTTMPRLIIASHLYANYKDKTFQTFHYRHNDLYHKTHLELDRLVYEYGANSVEFDEAALLLKNAPILKEEIESYPILHVDKNIITRPCNWYPSLFVNVICETWYHGTNFYITEKFWRAVATKTPFIIHGSQHILANLKKLGFKTFSDFWDEGYSEDSSFYNIVGIKQVLHNIARQPINEIHWMYKNMQEIVDHNFEVFMNISKHDIIKVARM